MNYNLPKYTLNEKTIPLDGFAVGGFNYGYPYEVVNKLETDGFNQPDWLVQEESGYLPGVVSALGSAAFGYRKMPPINDAYGKGYGQPQLEADPLAERSKAIPKQLRLTKEDYIGYYTPVQKLAEVQRGQQDMFARTGEITGVKNKKTGIFDFGAPAGWVETTGGVGALHVGTSF